MKIFEKNAYLLVLMLFSAGLAVGLTPNKHTASPTQVLDLSTLVPNSIGEWEEVTVQSTLIVNPQQKLMLDKLYSNTLSRTYVNKQGYQIMLSIAHGKGQKDGLEIHKPDICYPAQGFEITKRQQTLLQLKKTDEPLHAIQLLTQNKSRTEPLIYWTLIGSNVFTSRIEKKYIEIKKAFNDEIPDGMLVRISSIDKDEGNALAMQTAFAKSWFESGDMAANRYFFGTNNND